MRCVDSNEINEMKKNGYYLQITCGRKLSDILHSHTFYELLYVVSGSCVHQCNGKSDELFAGDLVFIPPQISHKFISQSKECDVIAVSVICEEMQKFMSIIDDKIDVYDYLKIKCSLEQRNVFMLLYEKNINANSIANTNAGRIILNQLLLFCITPIQNNHMPLSFANAIEQMQKPENAVKGVVTFLELSGFSHSQLCRLTKKYFNVTPIEYINRIKMNYAYRLVLDTDMDYETICEMVGFQSFSYFCKLFKKHFGCSAVTLRKENIHVAITV